MVQFAHVDIPILLCILIVVVLVHADAYVDARLLVLVLRQWLSVVRLVQVTLFLGLLVVVYHLELNEWLLLDSAVGLMRL